MLAVISGPHGDTKILVTCTHELAPAKHPSQKPLQRIQGNFVGLGEIDRRFDNLAGCQQTDIHRWREHALPEPRLTRDNRVFVISEMIEAIGQEVL